MQRVRGERIPQSAKAPRAWKFPWRLQMSDKESTTHSLISLAKSAGVQLRPQSERTDEAFLATRLAGVKVILAMLNIAIIVIDDTVPVSGTPYAFLQAIT